MSEKFLYVLQAISRNNSSMFRWRNCDERRTISLNEHATRISSIDAMNSAFLQQSLDSIIKQVDENKDYFSNEQFLKETIELIVQLKKTSSIDLIYTNDRLLIILGDCYLNLFQRCGNAEKLNEINSSLLQTISDFFLKISASSLSPEHLSILKQILLHPILSDEVHRLLNDFSLEEKSFDDHQIQILDHFFRIIQRLERISPLDTNEQFFFHIVQCIRSPLFFQTFVQSINEENLHWKERFLLHTCPDYLSSHSLDQESLLEIRQAHLHSFTQWIDENASSFLSWKNHLLITFRQISFLLILPLQFNRNSNLEQDLFNDYCQLIDFFLNILYSIIQSDHSFDNKHFHSLIGILISNLSTMIFSKQLEKYLQRKYVNFFLIKLTSFPNEQIQLNTLKILSSITLEQHTKNVDYVKQLTKVFLEYFEKIRHDEEQFFRLDDVLRCLQSIEFQFSSFMLSVFLYLELIQYERIQEEVIKENILRFLIENQDKSVQVQQTILEMLLVLTFNNEARQQIKENIDQLKSSLVFAHQGISKTLQYILWKLENDQQTFERQDLIERRNFEHDVILSFAHEDRQLAARISEQLISENFRVWMDEDNGFSTTIIDKCQIIDSCQYFLLCMSDSYQQNSYCRCEASYANERHYPIVPLIVTPNYRPDGWLSRIITRKFSIDFTKFEFEVAYNKLRIEIDRRKKLILRDPQSMDITVKK